MSRSRHRSRRGVTALIALALAALVAWAPSATAAFPGANGAIAFTVPVGGLDRIAFAGRTAAEPALVAAGSDPAWSADGTRLAVGRNGIAVARADGSGAVRLTSSSRDGDPTWSPDGSQIAFTRTVGRNQDIYVIGADGTGLRRLTRAPAPDQEPAWSPGGARIAFSSQRGGNWELYSMRADGRDERRLTRTSSVEGAPSWAPNGRSLAFYRVNSGRADVWIARADGRSARRLTRRAGNEVDPTWSPDGTRLAFATDRRGRWTIDVIRTNGTARTTVAIAAGPASHPDWQPLPASANATFRRASRPPGKRVGSRQEQWYVDHDAGLGASRSPQQVDVRRGRSSLHRGDVALRRDHAQPGRNGVAAGCGPVGAGDCDRQQPEAANARDEDRREARREDAEA